MNLCFATNNSNKLVEIQALLGDNFQLSSLTDIGCTAEIPEPFETITENSKAKAQFIWKHFEKDNFADDTGLEVYELGNEPGVYSARYAGPQRNATDNMNLLLQKLGTSSDRRARFVTIITLIVAGEMQQFEGTVEGRIITEQRGTNGFGYDPIFVPDGHTRTFAEMTLDEKGKLSHRARAFEKLVTFLRENSL
jgi:XTP/dITP diphosphohydrolase